MLIGVEDRRKTCLVCITGNMVSIRNKKPRLSCQQCFVRLGPVNRMLLVLTVNCAAEFGGAAVTIRLDDAALLVWIDPVSRHFRRVEERVAHCERWVMGVARCKVSSGVRVLRGVGSRVVFVVRWKEKTARRMTARRGVWSELCAAT